MNPTYKQLVFTGLFLTSGVVYAQNNTAFSFKEGEVTKYGKTATINLSEAAKEVEIQINPAETKHPNRFQYLDSLKKQIAGNAPALQNNTNIQYKTDAVPLPSLFTNFQGNYQMEGGTPTDNHIAVSNSGIIVSVVNTNIKVFDTTGKPIPPEYIHLSSFANSLGKVNRPFDPRVVYDPLADRFILLFLNGNKSSDNNLIIGFSQTANPQGKWNLYKLPGNIRKDTTWSDYPLVGISKDEFFVTVNLWNDHETCWDCDPTDAVIWQIDKASGYKGDSLISKNYREIKAGNKLVWNICPMTAGSTPHGPNMYFTATRNIPVQNDSIFLIEITNTVASQKNTLTVKTCKSTVPYGIQPHARQPDSTYLRTNFCDVQSGFYENGKIQFVANSIHPTLKKPAVYYGVIDNPQDTAPVVKATIFGIDTLDINYPSIAYAGTWQSNASIIHFLHSSLNTFPGMSCVFVNDSSEFSSVLRVKEGTSSVQALNDTVERWGDYTGIQRKYNEPGVCWVAGSYSPASGYFSGTLATWLAKIKSNDSLLSVPAELSVSNSFAVYPNPAANYVTLDFSLPAALSASVFITDATGRVIKTIEKTTIQKGKNNLKINTSGLSTGVYFIEIKNQNSVVLHSRFVVNK